jgi:hypothetical protein
LTGGGRVALVPADGDPSLRCVARPLRDFFPGTAEGLLLDRLLLPDVVVGFAAAATPDKSSEGKDAAAEGTLRGDRPLAAVVALCLDVAAASVCCMVREAKELCPPIVPAAGDDGGDVEAA